MRHTFFAALLSAGLSPHQMALEFPHTAIKGAEIDTVILDEEGQPEAAIEFKYHRDIPSGATAPRTMKAGQIFKDLVRLSGILGKCILYFVYLTDSTMANYFRNQPKPLSEFFDLAEGKVIVWKSQNRSQEWLRHFIPIWEIGLGRFVSPVCSEENCQKVTI